MTQGDPTHSYFKPFRCTGPCVPAVSQHLPGSLWSARQIGVDVFFLSPHNQSFLFIDYLYEFYNNNCNLDLHNTVIVYGTFC